MSEGAVLRVTTTDLLTGDTETLELPAGEYLIIATDPCYVSGTQVFQAKGTHVITLKEHFSQARSLRIDEAAR